MLCDVIAQLNIPLSLWPFKIAFLGNKGKKKQGVEQPLELTDEEERDANPFPKENGSIIYLSCAPWVYDIKVIP